MTIARDAPPPVAPPPSGVMGRLARFSAWSLVAYAVGTGATFIVSIVVGRLLGPRQFGEYTYYLWFLRLAPFLLALGIPTALSKHVPEAVGAGEPGRAHGLTRLALRGHLLVLPIPALAAGFAAWTRDHDTLLALAIAGGIGVAVLALDLDGLLGGLRRFDVLASVAVVGGIVQIGLAGVGVAVHGGWTVFVELQAIGLAANLIIAAVAARRQVRGWPVDRVPSDARRAFLKFAGVMAIVLSLDAVLFGRPELFFLDRWRPTVEVGYYGVALRLASLALALPMIASRALLPEFSWLKGTGRDEELRAAYPKLCKVMALVAIPLAFGGAAVAGALVRLLYGADFAGAGPATAILLAGSVVSAGAGPATAAVLTGHRPRFVIEIGIAAVAVNVVLDILLIPRYGLVAAAAVTVAVQTASVIVGLAFAWVRLGLRYPVRDVAALLACGLLAAGAANAVVTNGDNGIGAFATALVVGAVVYIGAVWQTRTVTVQELKELRHTEHAPEVA